MVKDLHIWWPHGARHFLDLLVDGDLASNNHGWQWAAGTGTDAALKSAGLVLVKGDLAALHRAFSLSRATMRNIRQNLGFAFAYNFAGIPLAAGLLYPLTGHLLNPMVAGAAMAFSSVSVMLNALRLRHAAV